MKYFYRIKIPKLNEKGNGFGNEWEYGVYDIGYIEAKDRKEARAILEDELNSKVCMRSKREDIGTKNMFLLGLYEPDEYWDKVWSGIQICEQCGEEFTKLSRDKANDFTYIKSGFCSIKCEADGVAIIEQRRDENFDFNGIHKAVIYKITNKINDKCYIGKTTQAFTLRWYQHFFQSTGAKFSEAKKETKLSDWKFEVIETFGFSGSDITWSDSNGNAKLLSEREQYWIDKYDSLNNGYNSVSANKDFKIVEPKQSALCDENGVEITL